MPAGLQRLGGQHITDLQGRQHALPVRQRCSRIIAALDIRTPEAWEVDGLSVGLEQPVLHEQLHAGPLSSGVVHLTGDRALPDQLVELGLIGIQLAGLFEGPKHGPCWANRLVSFLGILCFLRVDAGRSRKIWRTVLGRDQTPGGIDGLLREGHGVGPHVGDPAVLVQPLGDRHGAPGSPAQLADGLLLEGRGRERRRGLL